MPPGTARRLPAPPLSPPGGLELGQMSGLEASGCGWDAEPRPGDRDVSRFRSGPSTQSLGLSVRETDGDGTSAPVFGQLDLVNPAGATMAQFGPFAGPGANALQGMTVQLHNATSRLSYLDSGHDCRVVVGSKLARGTESGTTAGSSQASNGNVSFVLDVERQDIQSNVQVAGSLAQAPVSIGTLVVAPTPQGGSPNSSVDLDGARRRKR